MEASEIRRIARENLAGNWWLSVGVAFVAGLLGALVSGSGFSFTINEEILYRLPTSFLIFFSVLSVFGSILSLVQFIIGGTVQLGYVTYLLKQHDRASFDFNDLFSQFHRFGQGFAQAFLRGLYTTLWTLLFIIPGIVKSFSYAMTPFIMAENPDMTANEAITASRELMDGHKAELFVVRLSFIGWVLLSSLSFGIGYLFLNPYMNAADAAFYRTITSTPEVQQSSINYISQYLPERTGEE